jgi:cytochrome bd-type quinol oxidase subunit 2
MSSVNFEEQANNSVLKKLFNSPSILRAFGLVITVFVLFHIVSIFSTSSDTRINYNAIFGVITGNIYISVLFFLGLLIFEKRVRRNRIRVAVVIFLALIVVFYFLSHKNRFQFFNKPTERIGFVWSVVIPFMGVAIMLFSSQVIKFCKK